LYIDWEIAATFQSQLARSDLMLIGAARSDLAHPRAKEFT